MVDKTLDAIHRQMAQRWFKPEELRGVENAYLECEKLVVEGKLETSPKDGRRFFKLAGEMPTVTLWELNKHARTISEVKGFITDSYGKPGCHYFIPDDGYLLTLGKSCFRTEIDAYEALENYIKLNIQVLNAERVNIQDKIDELKRALNGKS